MINLKILSHMLTKSSGLIDVYVYFRHIAILVTYKHLIFAEKIIASTCISTYIIGIEITHLNFITFKSYCAVYPINFAAQYKGGMEYNGVNNLEVFHCFIFFFYLIYNLPN